MPLFVAHAGKAPYSFFMAFDGTDFKTLMTLESHGLDVFAGVDPVYPWGHRPRNVSLRSNGPGVRILLTGYTGAASLIDRVKGYFREKSPKSSNATSKVVRHLLRDSSAECYRRQYCAAPTQLFC